MWNFKTNLKGLYPSKNGVCLPPSSFLRTYTSAMNLVWGLTVPGFAITCPLSISFLCTPFEQIDAYIPEPERDVDKNFLMPVEDVFTLV